MMNNTLRMNGNQTPAVMLAAPERVSKSLLLPDSRLLVTLPLNFVNLLEIWVHFLKVISLFNDTISLLAEKHIWS